MALDHYQYLAAGAADVIVGPVLCGLAVVILAAFVCGRVAERMGQPAVMGEIVAGLALGPTVLGLLPGNPTEALFPAGIRPYLSVLAQVGLALFMFGVGSRVDPSHLRGAGRQVAAISLSSMVLPFGLGAGLGVAIHPWIGGLHAVPHGRLGFILFMGTAMSITAFPVLARIVTDRGLHKHRIGAMALACAALQDILAWCVLAVVIVVVSTGDPWVLARMLLWSAAFVVGLGWVVRPGLRRLFDGTRDWSSSPAFIHAVLLTGLLLSAWATNAIGLHAVFGAFAFGMVMPRERIDAVAPQVPERIEQTSLLLLPVFFTVTGLSVNFSGLGGHGLIMVAAVVVVACVGKFGGAAGAALLTGASRRDAAALGVLMNTRGLTELIILNVGLQLGVLDARSFTAMVIMALVTTLMAGPLLQRLYPAGVEAPALQPTVRVR
ncbi:cation:proton antiporter [Streptomyces sp. NPDC096354]|uniref:cation:proton antiporter n=1 Tax=Streptomyces sp. NPDC096354 TaxID=3366088 RepID=UPI0038257146